MTRRSIGRLAGTVLSAAILLFPSVPAFAQAQAEPQGARAHYQQGVKNYAEGDDVAALYHFQRAIEKAENPPPELFFNIGLVQLRLGFGDKATVSFSKYLGLAPEGRYVAQARAYMKEALGDTGGPETYSPYGAVSADQWRAMMERKKAEQERDKPRGVPSSPGTQHGRSGRR